MRGSLSVRNDDVVFAPETGVVAMPGRIDKAGHIVAGKTVAGADHKPFPMAFDGNLRGGRVTGSYATPRCRAMVELERPG